MKTVDQITAAIDATIAARKQQLPAIEAEAFRVRDQLDSLLALGTQVGKLLPMCTDDAVRAEAESAKASLDGFVDELENYASSLAELKAEFTRDTLNIGVSGAARTGKSTTLQSITGLTDSQIPSGGLNPVTAVRSEIYNSPRNEAVIEFETEVEFLEGYVRPHLDNVNACLPKNERLAIGSLASLRAAALPEKLDGAVKTGATDSLKRLREAKRSISSYENLLGSEPFSVKLDDVSRYVTYPAPEEEESEIQGGEPCDRRYLAVKRATIYCQFPNLGNAKVGLVDLPGLGEIGDSAYDIHLKGLEDKVDQVFLVMRPTAAAAFTDDRVAYNLDQLQVIQPAVRRGDLVLVGINKDEDNGGQKAADNLRTHFRAEVNSGRADGGYELVDYCALHSEDVARVFNMLLDRLGRLLPEMDKAKVAFCMGGLDLGSRVSDVCDQLVRTMDRILRKIPSSDHVMKQRIDSIEREVVRRLDDYAVELESAANDDSVAHKQLIAKVQAIHDDVARRIDDGLFRLDEAEWEELTRSSKDFYNLYRDEGKRIRYEIIDAYSGLDAFYGAHASDFKIRVLDTVLEACGMDSFFVFAAEMDADARIDKVASELGATLREPNLESALVLLKNVRFNFFNNVFLQIEEHLDGLANPRENYCTEYRSSENKRETLGGKGSSEHKQERMRVYLGSDAKKANDEILRSLTRGKDQFNKYLAVSANFFNNALYGKDEDAFKQVVLRGMIREYKPWVLPDADDASKSPLGQMAAAVKDSVSAIQSDRKPGGLDESGITKSVKRIAQKRGCVIDGQVVCVKDYGAFVSFGKG